MKTNIVILIFFLLSQLGFAQSSRKMIRGQVVNDSIKVENVIVFNTNARTGTITKFEGAFEISARENDTLVFSSLLFKSKKVVITKEDIENEVIIVPLKVFPNQLREVLVERNKTKTPKINSQAEVDKKYFDDKQSSPKNTVMPNYNAIENGVDFVRLYKDVLKLLRKKNPNKKDFTSNINFTEVVMQKIHYSFFTNSLKLRDDEIKLFLVFCENDAKAQSIAKSSTNFELMDFLVGQNNEFKKITALEK
ncbi:hypothetical protein [Flavobacterium sp.]|uniref:hypothetical protein n=1 Tax=Flavobacterium sp. TaxID=239 RepID=UPI00286C5613|nr:hypothetical protein [Flavobacterium sp.]